MVVFIRADVLNSVGRVIIDGTRLFGVSARWYNSATPIKDIQRYETVSKSEVTFYFILLVMIS